MLPALITIFVLLVLMLRAQDPAAGPGGPGDASSPARGDGDSIRPDPFTELAREVNRAAARFSAHPLDAIREASRALLSTLMIIRPILGKELRTLLRSRRAHALVLILVCGVGGYFLVFWTNATRTATFAERSAFSRTAFTTIFFAQFLALGMISAVITSAALTTERENRTLDLLLTTRFSRFEILLAKWFSAIIYQLVLIVSLLPILALGFQLGGIGNDEYWAALILTVTGVAAYGMVGMAFSAHARRTPTALMLSLATVAALIFFTSPHRLFAGGVTGGRAVGGSLLHDPGLAARVIWHGFILAGGAFAAVAGLARGGMDRATTAPRLIDDPALLERRRREWPYYLIDPLARPQQIRDNQNPVFVKEQRSGFLAKLQVLIRLTYLGMFLSLVVTVYQVPEGAMRDVSIYVRFSLAFIMLFIPVLASTAISREREEGTMDLLRVTLLEPRAIIRAKHWIALRFVLALGLSMMFIPFLTYVSGGLMTRVNLRPAAPAVHGLGMFAQGAVTMLAFSVLYASAALLCSAAARRNVTAIVSTYVLLAIVSFLPNVAGFFVQVFQPMAGGAPLLDSAVLPALNFIVRFVSPVLSPFAYYQGIGSPAGPLHAFRHWDSWPQTLLHAAILGAMSWILSILAARLARRDSDSG